MSLLVDTLILTLAKPGKYADLDKLIDKLKEITKGKGWNWRLHVTDWQVNFWMIPNPSEIMERLSIEIRPDGENAELWVVCKISWMDTISFQRILFEIESWADNSEHEGI